MTDVSPKTNPKTSPLTSLDALHLAEVGSLLRGNQDVGANEFIATLMNLVANGNLAIERDADDEGVGLRIVAGDVDLGKGGDNDNISPIDYKAIKLLQLGFAEPDGVVYLASAKQRGEERRLELDAAYKEWKQVVREQTQQHVEVDKQASLLHKVLKYAGYVCAAICLLLGYLRLLAPSVVALAIGAAALAASYVLQQRANVEKQQAREIYRWLNSLETHRDDVPGDVNSVQRMLQYACLFGIAEKTARSLQDCQLAANIDKAVADLPFWRTLRDALYTNPG